MVGYLEHVLKGKTQTLTNIISVTEKGNLIEIITTTEKFKIDSNKVKLAVTVTTNTREKLMEELNIKMDKLLLLDKQDKKENGSKYIEDIKNFIRDYNGVNEKDKNDLIEQIEELEIEVMLNSIIKENTSK